jgi:hypothetical protein
MPHDAFISHSNSAKLTAYAICNGLEAIGIRCWILPRDVTAGAGWDRSIANAVESSRIVILVLTDYGHRSDRVERQLELAFSSGAVVIPFRVEPDPAPTLPEETGDSLHWIDVVTPEVATRIGSLREQVRAIVGHDRYNQPQMNRSGAVKESESRTRPEVQGGLRLRDITREGDDFLIDGRVSDSAHIERNASIAAKSLAITDEELGTKTRIKTSKLFVLRALLLVIVPFTIVLGVGIWQTGRRGENAHPKQARVPGALIVQPTPSPSARAAATVPAVNAARTLAVTVQRRDIIAPTDPGWGATDANCSIADNKIRITPLPGNGAILVNTAHRFKDAEVTADVVMAKGEDLDQLGGLVFWAKDYNDCYALVMSASGKFAIGHKLFGRWINPTAKTANGAVKTGIGQVNKLHVKTDGKQFTAFINGVNVFTLTGEPPEGDWFIGLYGESAEASENAWDFTNVTTITALK